MRAHLVAMLVVVLWSARARADACHTRDDCQAGYKCVWNYCVVEHEEQTDDLWTHHPKARSSSSSSSSSSTQTSGVRSFVGLTLAGGMLNGGYTSSETTVWGRGIDSTALFALRGGVLLGRAEIALEIAPFTQFWDVQRERGPAFEANATVAYRVPFARVADVPLAWPLRAGVGILAGGDNTGDDVFLEARLDPIGVSFQSGPVVVDFIAPSIRYALTNGHVPGIAFEGVTTHYISFFFGSSVSYAF
jgi:hypothetical protein